MEKKVRSVSISIDKLIVNIPETRIEGKNIEDLEKQVVDLLLKSVQDVELIISQSSD